MAFYGSLDNRLAENIDFSNFKVEVGMGATELCYSDCHAYEVIEVKDRRHIVVRKYDTKRKDKNGMSECQDYEFISNPENRTYELFLTKNGRWVERHPNFEVLGYDYENSRMVTKPKKGFRYGHTFSVGEAREYFDYSF